MNEAIWGNFLVYTAFSGAPKVESHFLFHLELIGDSCQWDYNEFQQRGEDVLAFKQVFSLFAGDWGTKV